ncbi:MAG: fumarylacetoacetate hydrolase family protein [Pseudomonadota bacterium]
MTTPHPELDSFAKAMVEARVDGEQSMRPMPEPAITIDDAKAFQSAVFAHYGSPRVGWKVGATNAAAQAGFGLDGPFYGPIVEAVVMRSGSDLKKTPCVGAVEPEYAFKLKRAYPAPGEEVSLETLKDAVDTVHIAIEVIGRALGHQDFANGIGVTMDFGGNVAFVVGPEVADWPHQDLVGTAVTAMVDGETVGTGNGEPVMGDPINSVLWLAQNLAAVGQQIEAGEWISTGTCTAPVPGEAGKTVSARFGTFGEVSVNFV